MIECGSGQESTVKIADILFNFKTLKSVAAVTLPKIILIGK